MIRIGRAVLDDVPELASLLGLLFSQERDFHPDIRRQRRGLRRIIQNPEVGEIVVARSEGRVIGMVSLLFTISTAEGGPAAWLEDCVVAPGHRQRGVGSRLILHSRGIARRRGIRRLTLLVDYSNGRALRFYGRHGFTRSTMVPLRYHLENKRRTK